MYLATANGSKKMTQWKLMTEMTKQNKDRHIGTPDFNTSDYFGPGLVLNNTAGCTV